MKRYPCVTKSRIRELLSIFRHITLYITQTWKLGQKGKKFIIFLAQILQIYNGGQQMNKTLGVFDLLGRGVIFFGFPRTKLYYLIF